MQMIASSDLLFLNDGFIESPNKKVGSSGIKPLSFSYYLSPEGVRS